MRRLISQYDYQSSLFYIFGYTGRMGGIAEDSVRFAHSGPSQRFLRGLRPLVSVGPRPLPVSAGGHASSIPTILPSENTI